MSWQVVFAKHAEKDAKKLVAAGLKSKAQELLALLANEPLQNPPHFEKFMGDLTGRTPDASTSSGGWSMRSSSRSGWCGCSGCGRAMRSRWKLRRVAFAGADHGLVTLAPPSGGLHSPARLDIIHLATDRLRSDSNDKSPTVLH